MIYYFLCADKEENNMCEDEKETLTFEDIDILGSIGSDICESVRDLIYNIKTIKNDVDLIKKQLNN